MNTKDTFVNKFIKGYICNQTIQVTWAPVLAVGEYYQFEWDT